MEQPNLNYIIKLSGSDIIFQQKIIEIIKIELPLEISVYQENISAKNYKDAAECVHKLKHKISVLSLEKSYYIAEEFESNILKNSTKLKQEFENILTLMQEFVNSL